MIKLFQYDGKWRIEVVNETWEFETAKEMLEAMQKMINLKNKQSPHNDLNNKRRNNATRNSKKAK